MEPVDPLVSENQRLQLRIAQLESGIAEYELQMHRLLTSSSWRITSPLRMAAGRTRRLRWLPAHRRGPGNPRAGLLPPDAPAAAALAVRPVDLESRAPRGPAPVRTARVCVVVHVFYPELWDEICAALAGIPEAFDLVVTLTEGRADQIEPRILQAFPEATVRAVPNCGRDMGPLVTVVNAGLLEGYDAVLKLHTKRSPHRLDGDEWRRRLLQGLLPSPSGIADVLTLLRQDPAAGIVVPARGICGPAFWGANQPLVEALAARLPLAFNPEDLSFAAGSMFWCRPWLLQRLADLDLSAGDFPPEAGQTDATLAHALERFLGVMAHCAGLDIVAAERAGARLKRLGAGVQPPRVLAFYEDPADGLDWSRVESARPLFDRHLQPHFPGELGPYALSPTVLRQQAQLAADYGVSAFVLPFRWSGGRPGPHPALEAFLADPTLPVGLAVQWNGPVPADEDADRLLEDLLPVLRDPRYVAVRGRPLLVLGEPGRVPAALVARWRLRAAAAGLGGLHVVGAVPAAEARVAARRPDLAGLDGLVPVPPPAAVDLLPLELSARGFDGSAGGQVLAYAEVAASAPVTLATAPYLHPCVLAGWDLTPQRGAAATVLHGASPLSFRRWCADAVGEAASGPDPIVFVHAWNDWVRGAYLEPDVRFGRGSLTSLQDAMGVLQRSTGSNQEEGNAR